MLEDAAPMAAAEHLGQAVMEFDASATVETVIELDESGQVIIQADGEVITDETMEVVEEVTLESEEKSDEKNNH
jgi:segregation and condensation protein B